MSKDRRIKRYLKGYGNREGRAMRLRGLPNMLNGVRRSFAPRRPFGQRLLRASTRAILMAVCFQLAVLPVLSRTARAEDLMLMEETRRDTVGYGWLFLGLSLVAFGVAANDYQESQYNIKKAKDAYNSYLSADATTVVYYRELTTTYSHRAQAYESTTNAALAIGFILAATTIAIFRSDGKPDSPILLGDRTVGWEYKF